MKARRPGSKNRIDTRCFRRVPEVAGVVEANTHAPWIRSDELVIVLKPRVTMDHHAAFGPGEIGTAVKRLMAIGGAFTAMRRWKSLWTAQRSTNVNPSALYAAKTISPALRSAWENSGTHGSITVTTRTKK
ncbi:hypothetical protein MTO96_047592 [Rhipicephalus appendiculatus]